MTSLLIVAVIVWGTVGPAAGKHSDVDGGGSLHHRSRHGARAISAVLPGVVSIHDLHIWPMSTTETALTAHLVMPAGNPGDAFLIETCRRLSHDFKIGHATLQIEIATTAHCALEPDHVV